LDSTKSFGRTHLSHAVVAPLFHGSTRDVAAEVNRDRLKIGKRRVYASIDRLVPSSEQIT
jgi:hypothetical protein